MNTATVSYRWTAESNLDEDVVGVDFADHLIERARKDAQEAGVTDRVTFIVDDCRTVELEGVVIEAASADRAGRWDEQLSLTDEKAKELLVVGHMRTPGDEVAAKQSIGGGAR